MMMPFTSSDHPRHVFEESPCESRDAICSLCTNKVSFESNAYYCRECRSHFHKECLTITYPKSHEHPLTYIRRKISVPCDICGMDNYGETTYGCLQCDFFAHRECIYLPKVIKITRHSHRLYHILPISDGEHSCGICRTEVDVRYGGYSCIEKTCNYVCHSYCMLKYNVWNGKDVEGEPEEEVDPKVDLASLAEIDGRSIRHFSHDHDLIRLDANVEEESGQVCHACILPIELGNFLACKKCDFSLHDTCAKLPRKIESPLHIHPLTVHVDTMKIKDGFFTCSACNQYSCGFMYKCCQEDCGFKIDVKCASFVEPFNHSAHADPLYMAPDFGEFVYRCYSCFQRSVRFAACWITDSHYAGEFFDFKCVNLPGRVKYKCDIHPLVIYRCIDHSSWFECWCEICEEKINERSMFYTCHDCYTTLHVDCILGKYPYLKSGHRIKVNGFEVEIVSNNGVCRPICHTCHRVCQDKQIFIGRDDVCFCSIKCIHSIK